MLDILMRKNMRTHPIPFRMTSDVAYLLIYYKHPQVQIATEESGLKWFVMAWRNNALSVMVTMLQGRPIN